MLLFLVIEQEICVETFRGCSALICFRRSRSATHQLFAAEGQAAGAVSKATVRPELSHILQISMGERPRVIPITEIFTFDKVYPASLWPLHSSDCQICSLELHLQGLFLAIRAVQTLRRLHSSRTIVIGIAGESVRQNAALGDVQARS